ncbi:MAG TPA: HAD hydrolase-like protein [Isosphaeraceae bacterium]|nr:HAD hydrolase-like protein [Isosphaeraceae bacterium]
MTIFFDLDGPLLDVSPRYVALHHHLLREVGVGGMPGGPYWGRKRARVPEERILEELGASAHAVDYLRRRLELIETPDYLAYDRCWPWVEGILSGLADQYDLVLVTVRSQRPALLEELERLDLARFFREILSVPSDHHVDRQKAGLIRDFLGRHRRSPQGSWMVGDTEADIDAGRLVGLHTAGVLCGIRDRQHLAAARPDVLLDDIRALPQALGASLRPVASGFSVVE